MKAKPACSGWPEDAARPIVKWAGGKTKLLAALLPLVPIRIDTYVEPFAGGAALFFALASETPRRFKRAVLCDANPELAACYRAVKTDVDGVIKALGRYRNSERMFYAVRARDTRDMGDVERAARLLFLNRTCFNGLWRVNSKGLFNVPFGQYANPRICNADALRAASRALACATIRSGDFATATRRLGRHFIGTGDFVYCDPPYVPLSTTADFTSYAAGGFGADSQKRLLDELKRLRRAGARVIVSNADTRETRALYKGFRVLTVKAPRAINSDKAKRGLVRELVVVIA